MSPTLRSRAAACLLAVLALAWCGAVTASAQSFDTQFGSLAADSSEPIEIEADELEVRDSEGVAVFTGNVTVKREAAALQTRRLTVVYARGSASAAASGTATAAGASVGGAATTDGRAARTGNQEIERLEAEGKVLVTAEGQAASGERGFVDLKTKVLELVGNVTLTQGPNVVTGDRLVVNLDNGSARMESQSRVRMLLTPNAASQ